jgi:hypothetical protein
MLVCVFAIGGSVVWTFFFSDCLILFFSMDCEGYPRSLCATSTGLALEKLFGVPVFVNTPGYFFSFYFLVNRFGSHV